MHSDKKPFSKISVIGICLVLAACTGIASSKLSLLNHGDHIEQNSIKTVPVKPVSGRYGKFLQAHHAEVIGDYFTAARIQYDLWRKDTHEGLFGYNALHNAMLSGQHQMAIELATVMREQVVQPTNPNNQNAAAVVLAMQHLKHGQAVATIREAQNAIVPVGIAQYVRPLFIAWGHVEAKESEKAYKILEEQLNNSAMRNVYLLNMVYIDLLAQKFSRAEQNIRTLHDSLDRPPRNIVSLYAATLSWHHGKPATQTFIRRIEDDELRRQLFQKMITHSAFTLNDLQLHDAAAGLSLGIDEISKLMAAEAPSLALFYANISSYLNPRSDAPNYIIGDVLFDLERYDDALRALNKITNPQSFLYRDALSLAAETEQKIGQYEKAITRLERAIARFPADTEILFDLGLIYHYEEDYNNAIKVFSRTIESREDGEKWSDFYFRGIGYERTKQWELAEQDFQRALQIDPNNAYVLNYLGYSWIDQRKNIPQAFKMLERAVELKPDNAFIVDSLGWALYRMKEFEKAAIHLERAIEMEPAEAVINDHLGDVYWHIGRKIEARYQWERALTLELDSDQERQNIEAKLAGRKEPKP